MMLPWQWPLRYKQLFTTIDGHAVLIDMARKYRVFRSEAPTTPELDAYKKGQRDVILNLIEVAGLDEATFIENYQQQMRDNNGSTRNTGQQ